MLFLLFLVIVALILLGLEVVYFNQQIETSFKLLNKSVHELNVVLNQLNKDIREANRFSD